MFITCGTFNNNLDDHSREPFLFSRLWFIHSEWSVQDFSFLINEKSSSGGMYAAGNTTAVRDKYCHVSAVFILSTVF